MTDQIVEPEGAIEIQADKHGVPASVTLYFVFDGDWANMYEDVTETEAEARALFVREVQSALEAQRDAARGGDQTERPSGDENRGA